MDSVLLATLWAEPQVISFATELLLAPGVPLRAVVVDCVWYLYSDEELRRSGRAVLAPGDHAQLVRIPLPRQMTAPPVYTRVFTAATPGAALSTLEAEQAARVRYFLARVLTPAERALAVLVASEVLTVPEIAARLGKAPKTVTNQLNTIYSELESEFGLQADVGVKREFLRALVGQRILEAD